MAIAFDATLGTVTNAATLTTSASAASGSRVFLFTWWYDPTATCTGASGGGLTWVVDHQSGLISADSGSHLAILSADAPSGLASSTNLTPTYSTAVDFGPGHAAHSWTGMGTGSSGYVDTTSAKKEDFNEAWTTNNLVTTMADTLLLGYSIGANSAGNTAAGTETERHDWLAEGGNRCAVVSRVVASAATYTPGGTWAGTVDFQANIGVAYEAAAGGPPPTFEPELIGHTQGGRW